MSAGAGMSASQQGKPSANGSRAFRNVIESLFKISSEGRGGRDGISHSIKKGGELDVFLRYGIVKERMSALLTDTIRAMILEDMGYSVDMIEFVDLEQSPKNLMIRAKKTKIPSKKNRQKIAELIDAYKFNQTLYRLVDETYK